MNLQTTLGFMLSNNLITDDGVASLGKNLQRCKFLIKMDLFFEYIETNLV